MNDMDILAYFYTPNKILIKRGIAGHGASTTGFRVDQYFDFIILKT